MVTAGWSTLAALVLISLPGLVQAACETSVGKFVSITGAVDVQSSGGNAWSTAKLETRLCEGDTIRVGERSRAAVSLINNAVLRIDQNTAMRLIDITPQDEEQSLLDLFTGAFQSFSRKPKFLRVNTPYLNGSVEGTEFVFRVKDDEATITVLEGVVLASNNQGELRITPGESAQASKGQAPQKRVVVKPRDLVQWGLYYPSVFSTAAVAAASPAMSEAANCAANGNNACAFAALDKIPQAQRDAQYLLLRSTVLLSAGRVDEARTKIDAALQKDPNSGAAYALRAVIAVALNENEAALADARRAVELSPQSAASTIALSYALQANLQLEPARTALLELVDRQPDDALAWARLAELHLMLGDRREATAAAERAVALQPGLGRTQSVRGFTALAEIDTARAQAAFEQAIALDSADPLPRLGLGLAKIRRGQLDEGRSDLEAAVALDSNNALLRAYLGKAYFEEKRAPLDATQFEVAKELDPLDPTAYLYDAIRKQIENDPVGALRDFYASIARNDNRAIYRSQLLLDKDRAARGTSLARAYQDLSFHQSGINEATKSLDVDPANASAHRFLADVYLGVRRHEISRVSNLMQAQLLQDVNINPLQPSIAATNLNIGTSGGPASAGFNEFTPLFESNQTQLNLSGFLGNHDTSGGEAIVSGIYNQFSYSFGAFSSDTDGWRSNNDLDQDIYNLFLQAALTASVNAQIELSRRKSDEGDLRFNFDPDDYSREARVKRDTDTARFGLRISPSGRPQSTLLFNLTAVDRNEKVKDSSGPDEFDEFFFYDGKDEEDGTQTEAQWIERYEALNLIVGGAYSDVDRKAKDRFLFTDLDLMPVFDFSDKSKDTIKHPRGYAYAQFQSANGTVDWTLGASYDDYEEGILEKTSFNPKFGVRWQIKPGLEARAAAFKVMKPALVNNRMIEPTQVAGFNQFYDDINGTRAWRYAGAVDWQPLSNLTVGAEASWRELDEPTFVFDDMGELDTITEDRREQHHKLYLYWTPTDRWSATASFVYDRYKSDKGISTELADLPEKVRTLSLPLTASYFHPSGFYAGAAATYVDQKVVRAPTALLADGTSDFVVVDAVVGYRLPKRRGSVGLQVKNLFDNDFKYQDDSYREFSPEPSIGPYFPDIMVMGFLSLEF
jgi:tetratricopeptide (TPR) repeat protein